MLVQKSNLLVTSTNLQEIVKNLTLKRILFNFRTVVQIVLLLQAEIHGTLDASCACSLDIGASQREGFLNVVLLLVQQILVSKTYRKYNARVAAAVS